MSLSVPRIRQCLQTFDFKALFTQELGWDKHSAHLTVAVDGKTFTLQAIAEKRGMQVFQVTGSSDGFPDYELRRKIERQVAKLAHEHIIIYTDADKTVQKWQWVRREPGRPLACRETGFQTGQSGEALVQKLQLLAVNLAEEEELALVHVTGRAKQAFDVDKITKRFYERFKTEHASFLKFIKGITATGDREWYASLMLNRLMFIYFIQKKGFLDGDLDYLRRRLHTVQEQRGKDKFHGFYRYFLIRLFHEGLGQPKADRKKELDTLLGEVPYLNGGLFDVHALEEANPDIQIADDAFKQLFDFFDEWHWHLDDRPLRDDKEINPDVLGYIFEKYINQKQMGAYYTKEDITGYIARNTIIPFLFSAAEKKCAIAFHPESHLWKLLREDPDRYLYPAVRKGVDEPLPEEIEAGVKDVAKRGKWNKPAAAAFALPTETWREHVARRQRCLDVRAKLKAGEITTINDLITYNLDICQFAQDAIDACEGPELLRAFYRVIAGHIPEKVDEKYEPGMSVLDPTCGSGAFLFAALNILEPLYEGCLDRMQAFVDDQELLRQAPRSAGNEGREQLRKYADFRLTLEDVARHPNRRYFILKSIIVNNLFGVDIMEEAVEICKLRLFLKLVAQVDLVRDLEPLPDIDFNIRPGNTLVGFASLDEVRKAFAGKLDFESDVEGIIKEAGSADDQFQVFRRLQTRYGPGTLDCGERKTGLRQRFGHLRDQLDRCLARIYGVDEQNEKKYRAWLTSHAPFHWFAEFYGIMRDGGFDVIIGNPPYIEFSKVRGQYGLLEKYKEYSTNLYAACCYQAIQLKSSAGRSSFIVPISLPSTDRMESLRLAMAKEHSIYHASFSNRPSKLFDGAEQRLTIYLHSPAKESRVFSGGYLKWYGEERPYLFNCISYVEAQPVKPRRNIWPKVHGPTELKVLDKVKGFPELASLNLLGSGSSLYYKNTGIRYFNTVTLRPPKCWIDGVATSSSRETVLPVIQAHRHVVHDVMLSTTFLMYYQFLSNCRDLNPADITTFPLPDLSKSLKSLNALSTSLEEDYTKKGKILTMKKRRSPISNAIEARINEPWKLV